MPSNMIIAVFLATIFSIAMGGDTTPPPQYIFVNNNMVRNPAWEEWKRQNNAAPSTVRNSAALPIASTYEDAKEWKRLNRGAQYPAAFQESFSNLQTAAVADRVGSDAGSIVDGLFQIFKQYEVPIGMLNKLMELQNYETLCFLIDDSGSMDSEVHPPTREMMLLAQEIGQYSKCPSQELIYMAQQLGLSTAIVPSPRRWTEACNQVLTMLKVLQYVPKGDIHIHFLNQDGKLILSQQTGESAEGFYHRARGLLLEEFRKGPNGVITPMLEKIKYLLDVEYNGRKVVHYWFSDGVPTGIGAVEKIKSRVMHRPNPQNQPITFVSCSDMDEEIEWMKQIEEFAFYCAEVDDFVSERKEVEEDQGTVFPYSYGVYLCCLLVGALNPHDLDALDESVPMTKFSLDCLMGITLTEDDYWRYFNGVVEAQRRKGVSMQEIMQNKPQFLMPNTVSTQMQFVKEFRVQLAIQKQQPKPLEYPPESYAPYTTSPSSSYVPYIPPSFSSKPSSSYDPYASSSFSARPASSYDPSVPSYSPSQGYADPSANVAMGVPVSNFPAQSSDYPAYPSTSSGPLGYPQHEYYSAQHRQPGLFQRLFPWFFH